MNQNIYCLARDGKRTVWDVRRLWALSAEFPVIDFEIETFTGLDIDMWFCGVNEPTVRAVYQHCLRIDAADLAYPIMLDPDGLVIDGVHRLLKAKRRGLAAVSAVRFETMPAPDRVEDWPPPAPASDPTTSGDSSAAPPCARGRLAD